MSYLSIAKTKGHTGYFVFRGTTLAADGVTTTPVAWSNVPLATAAGPVRARLVGFSAISRGLAETVGGDVEAAGWSMTLEDSDRSLKSLLVGTQTAILGNEYSADSVLNLFGQVFHGVVDPVTGVSAETPLTPPMALSGSATYDGNKISLPMSSRHDNVIGNTLHRWSVADIKNGTFDYDGAHDVSGTGFFADSTGNSGAYSGGRAGADFNDWSIGLDAAAPFMFGMAAIRLLPTSSVEGNKIQALAFISIKEPEIDAFGLPAPAGWGINWGGAGGMSQEQPNTFATVYKIQRWVQDAQNNWVKIWVVWFTASFVGRSRSVAKSYSDVPIYLVPTYRHTGVATHLDLIDESATPSNVVRRMVIDHSLSGASGIDNASFAAVRAATMENLGMVGGFWDGRSSISEIASYIAQAFGLSFYIGTDGKLRVVLHAAWGPTDAALVAAGTLPQLGISDVIGDWSEEVPFGQGRLGTSATLTTVDWSQEQTDFWPRSQLPASAPGGQKVPLGRTIEARVSGAWVYPGKAAHVLALMASRRLYPTRRIRFRTHLWVASYELGQIFLVSYPRGLEVTGSSGYQLRPMRLERLEIDLAQRGVLATFEDLGPATSLKPGLLDDYANWVNKTPAGGNNLTITNASTTVAAVANIFDITDVGRTLVTRGAVGSDGNTVNRKINGFIDARHVTVAFAYDFTETIVAGGAGIDAAWLVVDNHVSKGAGFRPGYIRAAKEGTRAFTNGDPGYNYTGTV